MRITADRISIGICKMRMYGMQKNKIGFLLQVWERTSSFRFYPKGTTWSQSSRAIRFLRNKQGNHFHCIFQMQRYGRRIHPLTPSHLIRIPPGHQIGRMAFMANGNCWMKICFFCIRRKTVTRQMLYPFFTWISQKMPCMCLYL